MNEFCLILWIFFYNVHLRKPLTLASVAEHLAVEMPLPVLTTYVCRGWDSNTQTSACKANALTDCATAVAEASETL